MPFIRDLLVLTSLLAVSVNSVPLPGGSYHHVHHRIHVPQKVKTIYHTKIIKVPEHHHYFHEKEKIIIEKPKEEHHPVILKDEEPHDWSELDDSFKRKRNAHQPLQTISRKKKKEKPKEEHHAPILKDDDIHNWSELEDSFKKKKRNAHHPLQPISRKNKKKRVVRRPPYPYYKP